MIPAVNIDDQTKSRVLVVAESDLVTPRQIMDILSLDENHPCQIEWVKKISGAIERLKVDNFDFVLIDFDNLNGQNPDACKRIRKSSPNALIVILATPENENSARQALCDGADDYFLKDRTDAQWQPRALYYAIKYRASQTELIKSRAQVHDLQEALLDEKQQARKMSHLAQHDFLTGLANRALLMERLSQAIGMAQRHDKQVAMVFLDLDGFKMINDELGHAAGDLLLQQVATRLVKAVRYTDTVCRQGGDEFVILLTEISEKGDAHITAEKICESLSFPFCIEGRELHVTASFGVSVYPDDGDTMEALLKQADVAMYSAKTNRRNNAQVF